MAGVCEEFGISRKTGYKIFQRYQAVGLHGLTDRSRRPFTTVARFWYVRKAPVTRCCTTGLMSKSNGNNSSVLLERPRRRPCLEEMSPCR